jgi:predicted O-methyltransferase YrrM
LINFHLIKSFIRHWFKARRGGHGAHSPFVFTLCEEVFYNTNSFYDFDELDKIRALLLKNETILNSGNFGAGSKQFKATQRKIKRIASVGISTQKQNEILYRLVNFLQPKVMVELGTSLGLNTLYLALGHTHGKVITIEGSAELSNFAERLGKEISIKNIQYINQTFDQAIPNISKIDMAYIDGNHTQAATLAYFYAFAENISEGGFLIFDDIYWSNCMTAAWREIILSPKITLSIDLFYFGIVFFKKEVKQKVHYKIWI